MPFQSNISNYWATLINQYEEHIYSNYWITNPYASLIPSRAFDVQMGLVPQVLTSTSDLPTAYPYAESTLALSTGTGTSTCSPDPKTINFGYINRTYQLTVEAWETPTFCLTDVQFDFQAEQQARNLERGLMQYSLAYLADWHRVKNISMMGTKLSTTGSAAFATSTDSTETFAALSVPTVALNWTHLGTVYDDLCRIGAQQYAVGMADGAPVFSLNIGPGLKRLLFQTNTLARTSVDFSSMGKDYNQNFLPRGVNYAIYGWLPNTDLLPIRYDAQLNPIYPYLNNRSVTKGSGAWKNANYLTVANGGTAVYEAFSAMARNVYTRRPRPVGPTAFSQQTFNPVTYAGEVRFINNPDMGQNKLGNYGLYRIDFQQAAMPEFPEFGWAGITLAVD